MIRSWSSRGAVLLSRRTPLYYSLGSPRNVTTSITEKCRVWAFTSSFFTSHSWNCSHDGAFSFSTWSSASQKAEPAPKMIVIPPNLKFDPKSSFAPRPVNAPRSKDDGDGRRRAQPTTSAQPPSLSREDTSMQFQENEPDQAPEHDKEDDEDNDELLVLPPPEVTYAVPLPQRLHVEVHTLLAPAHSSQVGTLWLDATVFGQDPIRVDLMKRAVDYYRAKKRGRRKAQTKTIAQVSGSGKKIRPQKGTGQARAGHKRPPHFRGGAKAHGPKGAITDYGNTKLNHKVRQAALRHALSQKLKEGNLILLNQLHDIPTHKTNQLAKLLEPWGIGRRPAATGNRDDKEEDNGTSALILDHYYPAPTEENPSSPPAPSGSKKGRQPAKAPRWLIDSTPEGSSSSPPRLHHKGIPLQVWLASRNLPGVTFGNHHDASVYAILKHEKLVVTLEALAQLERRLSQAS